MKCTVERGIFWGNSGNHRARASQWVYRQLVGRKASTKNRKTCPARYEKWPKPVVDVFGQQQRWHPKSRRTQDVDEEPHLEEIALLERLARSEEGETSSGIV